MRRTIIWLLYIFMGVQIVLGCAYFATNFLIEQQFAENYASALPSCVTSLIHLVLAALSAWYFLGKFGDRETKERKFLRGYICAFLLTVPYLLQMHMAKLVWSPALSCFLWMMGLLLETVERGVTKKRVCLLAGVYFLYGIICPGGMWPGGILLLFGSFFCKKEIGQAEQESGTKEKPPALKNGKIGSKAVFRLAVFAAACVIFLANRGLNSAFPTARKIYREENLGTAAVSRLVWPNFASNYYFWDNEVKEIMSENDGMSLYHRIDLIETEFYPRMVDAYGTKEATRLCLRMGYRCLKDRSKETVLEIITDFKDHLFIPFTIENNLRGRGTSLTAWNYGRIKAHTPILVKYYYRYGTFELPFLLLGSLLLWWFHRYDQISQWMKERTEKENGTKSGRYMGGKRISLQWRLLGFAVILYTLWYTMRSNLPIDYKLVLPILFIWYLASIGGLLCLKTEN